MSRFQQLQDPSGNPQLTALYREIVDSGMGEDTPVNWFTAQAERPDILAATWALTRGVVLQGMLPPTIKQMIIVLVSTHNNCRYCRVTHTRALEALEVPRELIDNFTTYLDLSKVPPQQRAILQFALQTSQNPRSITDEDFQALRDYGLNDGEIMEIAMTAAFTNFINTWSEVSAIEIDKEKLS